MGAEPKLTVEESFRLALEDVARIATELAPFCETTKDLIGVVTLAGENDAQLKMIMALMAKKK